MKFSGQRDRSRKAPVDHGGAPGGGRPGGGATTQKRAGRPGTLWQRKMRSLALRLSKQQVRRDRSGAPMKRGS